MTRLNTLDLPSFYRASVGFNRLFDEIERQFEGAIVWQRLDSKKASRIKHEIPYANIKAEEGRFFEEANREAYLNWYVDAMKEFYTVLYPVWENVQKEID